MGCLICERIEEIKKGENRHFVAELETGYVVFGDFQFFKGYSLLLAKEHLSELHEFPTPVRERFLIEMSLVAEAVYKVFKPRKLNYECLGNAEPHAHWHIFPRYEDDPSPNTPSWKVDKSLRYNEKYRPSDEELLGLKERLLEELEKVEGISILSTWKDSV